MQTKSIYCLFNEQEDTFGCALICQSEAAADGSTTVYNMI